MLYSKSRWPLLFSRSYKARTFSEPHLLLNDVIIKVNYEGVHVVESDENVLVKYSFEEITDITSERYAFEFIEMITATKK